MEINSLVQILETPIKITESSSDGSLWRWGHFAHGITFLVVSMLTWAGINSSMNLHLKNILMTETVNITGLSTLFLMMVGRQRKTGTDAFL